MSSLSVSILSALAAISAAVLAGLNLYFSGRREHNKWTREVLVDVLVSFLNASFDSAKFCNRLADMRRSDDGPYSLADIQSGITAAHDEQTSMLTKMRLLATPRVVDAAMRLHLANHSYVDFVEAAGPAPDQETQAAAGEVVWEARRAFLTVAKVEIGLRRDVSSVTHAMTR
jgi:hypothetical protein